MMCPSCDKDIPDYSVFCLYCGARINVTGEVEHSFMPDSFVSKVTSQRLQEELLHQVKNELIQIRSQVQEAMEASPGRARNVLLNLSSWVSKRIAEIQEIRAAEVTETSVNINDEIQAVVKYLNVTNIKRKDIFECILDENIPLIQAVEAEIREVILAVIANAARAVQGVRHPEITISSGTASVGNIEILQVTVLDNGAGISEIHKDHVFERGYTTYPDATGMGLYIARSVLQTYGGKIYYESGVGRGTSFYIQLPLRRLRVDHS